ncbi:Ribosome-associated molecular chaperone SSB1 [Frankliniella fusca]|uniref:Ribosome-associated molecular chaperone SSB1 n=1 Tax=Frankliniella fusca TaxID=407009 RepID=A0AAE1HP80_9NEOP|nr:Ribosome-associated molecular chaperone SSB1 [Frankliniella fusca]
MLYSGVAPTLNKRHRHVTVSDDGGGQGQVLRDGLHQAAGHRRLQAPGGDGGGGGQDKPVQEGVPVHLRVGDPRPPAAGVGLHQRQHPQRKYPHSDCGPA